MNQFIDLFVDEMVNVHQKLQIAEPPSESYPEVDLCMSNVKKTSIFFIQFLL